METGKDEAMSVKWIGAILVVAACGGFGFLMASAYKREEKNLRQLAYLMEYMSCELEYRLTPLPELCARAAEQADQQIKTVFSCIAEELEGQALPDVAHCMTAALLKTPQLPPLTREPFMQMGVSLGQFDLSGQLKGLKTVETFCQRELDKLSQHREERLRSYQTLGLCAGAALAILFI